KLMHDLVAQQPKDADAHSGLATALDAAGKHEDAIAEYKVALQIRPDDPILLGNLGWSQYGAKKYEEALQSSRKALAKDSKLAYVWLNLGLIYSVQNRWNDAEREYKQALAVSTAADLHSGINDIKEAMKQQPNVSALRLAFEFLTAAEKKK